MKFSFLLCAVIALSTGCVSGTRNLGRVGNVHFYQVKARSFCGPNITLVVSQVETADECEQPQIVAAAGGTGIGHTIISAAGNAGAAAAFGLSLRPDKTQVSNGSASDSNAQSESSASGSGSSTTTGGTYNRTNGYSANAPGHNKP